MQTKIFLWGTWLVVLAVYIGFAGSWGALTRIPARYRVWFSVGFGLFVMLPSSLALPYAMVGKVAAWVTALGVASIFYVEPARFPACLWDRRFILYYFGAVMFLILSWTAYASAGDPLAWLWLGLPAGVAGCLVIRRACRSAHLQNRSGSKSTS
jgi:hypothetical protein